MQGNGKLNIAIDCRIADPRQGVGSAVLALAKSLSKSQTTEQQYSFIVLEEQREWLAEYIDGPCDVVGIPPTGTNALKKALRGVKPLRKLRHFIHERKHFVPSSDGYIESRKFDLVHFPTQAGYLTPVPSIFQPWDLQHIHYPQFFTREEYDLRERNYRAFCRQAKVVCVQAEWTKNDLIQQYGLEPERVCVIPWASVLDSYTAPAESTVHATVQKFQLPADFFFYPAVTWKHKNHAVVLEALHILKKKYGMTPPVYFSGAATDYKSVLNRLTAELDLTTQVHFPGFLSADELQVFFGMATAMIFPSKFEGFGLPILEAFHAGLPVLASTATTLPEVGKDGALYFNPDAAEDLAERMKDMLENPTMRQEMIRKGKRIVASRSMKEVAAEFQSLYEKVARPSFSTAA